MAIVTSYDWESDSWTHHNGDTPARQAFRQAVAEIAAKAKETLPECNGRVDSAVKIVLAGDVELQADGTARVASQSNGQITYYIVNGECTCKDYPKAPSNWCKHRIAAGLAKRVAARLQAQGDTHRNGNSLRTAAEPVKATDVTSLRRRHQPRPLAGYQRPPMQFLKASHCTCSHHCGSSAGSVLHSCSGLRTE